MIRIKSYNVLAQMFATGYWENNSYVRRKKLPYWLEWTNRSETVLEELLKDDYDILCLQETQISHYEFFKKNLERKGYIGVIQKKKSFGNAIFFKKLSFKLVWKSDRSRILIIQLEDLDSKNNFFVCNCHLEGNPYANDTRGAQVKSMFKYVKRRVNHLKLLENSYSVFVVGDFNETSNDGVYKLLTKGKLQKDFEPILENSKRYFKEDYEIPFVFKSANMEIMKKEPNWTYKNDNVSSCVDFIFYCGNVEVLSVKVPVSEEKPKLRIPNKNFGSDHLPVCSTFKFK